MIVRLQNPAAVQLPAVRRLFLAALARGVRDPEYVTDLIASKCQDPRIGIWIGLEGGAPKGFFVARLPVDPRTDDPIFDLAANFGSRALSDELLAAAVEFVTQNGYDRAIAWNQTGRSDETYIRMARRSGLRARHKCSVIELDLKKEEPSNGHGRIEPTERERV